MAFWERIECRICGIKRTRTENDETRSLTALMDRYTRADQAERISLWLQHRDLRTEFSELDRMG